MRESLSPDTEPSSIDQLHGVNAAADERHFWDVPVSTVESAEGTRDTSSDE